MLGLKIHPVCLVPRKEHQKNHVLLTISQLLVHPRWMWLPTGRRTMRWGRAAISSTVGASPRDMLLGPKWGVRWDAWYFCDSFDICSQMHDHDGCMPSWSYIIMWSNTSIGRVKHIQSSSSSSFMYRFPWVSHLLASRLKLCLSVSLFAEAKLAEDPSLISTCSNWLLELGKSIGLLASESWNTLDGWKCHNSNTYHIEHVSILGFPSISWGSHGCVMYVEPVELFHVLLSQDDWETIIL